MRCHEALVKTLSHRRWGSKRFTCSNVFVISTKVDVRGGCGCVAVRGVCVAVRGVCADLGALRLAGSCCRRRLRLSC
eukprot:3060358-Pyramimonas_sp.AAC.1